MQGTVVMLLALSGLGCHHKKVDASYVETCYSSGCYSSCYSSSCYSSCYSGGYSSCYSGGYSSCYSGGAYSSADYGCYSSCYSSRRHHHGLFGHKRRACQACYTPAPAPPVCDPCSGGGSSYPVYGTYTPVYSGYASGQSMGSAQSYPVPVKSSMAPAAPTPGAATDVAPAAPEAPSPGNPAPPVTPPPPAAPAPVVTPPTTPPPPAG
jgi:hypothetical protein